MIRFERVRFEFPGGAAALLDFDLHVPKGALVVLVGASGAGKTTALRLINRMLSPVSGRILVDGCDAAVLDPIALRRSIGWVIQGAGLIPHMSVAENVGLVPRLLGFEPERIDALVREGLKTVRLAPEEFLGRYPGKLSGGERQRVGIARALAADPAIVLMDEPFGALDAVLREGMQDEFKDLLRRLGKTTVLVTHDMYEAVHMGERLVVLKDGRIQQQGKPEEIVQNPANAFVAGLLGRRRRDLERFARENAA